MNCENTCNIWGVTQWCFHCTPVFSNSSLTRGSKCRCEILLTLLLVKKVKFNANRMQRCYQTFKTEMRSEFLIFVLLLSGESSFGLTNCIAQTSTYLCQSRVGFEDRTLGHQAENAKLAACKHKEDSSHCSALYHVCVFVEKVRIQLSFARWSIELQ